MTNDTSCAPRGERLLSDEPTVELVFKAQRGDGEAVEAILERCVPRLRRWAHGRLPNAARRTLDTNDLVQETVLHVLSRLEKFEVRHVGAMQGYLRRSVINRIRDEVRRIGRRPEAAELSDEVCGSDESPLDAAIRTQAYDRYRAALPLLRPRDREIVIARVDLGWSHAVIAERFGFASIETARRVVARALQRLKALL